MATFCAISNLSSAKLQSRVQSDASMAPVTRGRHVCDPEGDPDDSDDELPYSGGGGNGGGGNGGGYPNYQNSSPQAGPALAIGFQEIPKVPKCNGCTKLKMRKFQKIKILHVKTVKKLKHQFIIPIS